MYWILYGLYVLLGMIGSVFFCIMDHINDNKYYYKHKMKDEFKPFRLSRRGCLVILICSGLIGPLVFLIGFGAFMVQWITEDWTGFWSKPVCNCFESKKEK